MMTVSYFSSGVSSAVATKLYIDKIERIIYTHIDDQHPDSLRFVKDCEEWFGKPIEIIQSGYKTVDEVCRKQRWFSSPRGAVCTSMLKVLVKKKFEYEMGDNLTIVWGLDLNEKHRDDRIISRMPNNNHVFPLIDAGLTKEETHKILKASGIKRPKMYELGYNNNNCIGCIKGGVGYWNKIRIDFPEVFASRSKLERDIGHNILKNIYLDELDPEAGREQKIILDDCGILCEVMKLDNE